MGQDEGAGEQERGPKRFGAGAFKGRQGLGGPCTFFHPECPTAHLEARVSEGQQCESGARAQGSPIPGVAAPDPLGGAPRGRSRFTVSPQEAGGPDEQLCSTQRVGPR